MKLNAMSERIVFCFWTDDTPMSQNRRDSLSSLRHHIGCPVQLITTNSLPDYLLAGYPLHPAYIYLSATQKSDYLRCYFMHHYGGGYCDIKKIYHDWNPFFEQLEKHPEKWVLGYREIGEHGVAILPGELGETLRRNWSLLLGNGAYIFKPGTPFTCEWIENLHATLDRLLPQLERYPARFPQDCQGVSYQGSVSRYPITWSGIGGSIVHPLCLKYADKLLQGLPLPCFEDYR